MGNFSWQEPFGMTAIEGLSNKMVVVGSDVGGLSEIIKNKIPTPLFVVVQSGTLVKEMSNVGTFDLPFRIENQLPAEISVPQMIKICDKYKVMYSSGVNISFLEYAYGWANGKSYIELRDEENEIYEEPELPSYSEILNKN